MKRDGFKLNRSQRMQLKAFICLLGVLLIVLLLVGKLVSMLSGGGQTTDEEESSAAPPHIPVVEELRNVWIMEESEEGILVFCEGERRLYSWGVISDEPEGEEAERYHPAAAVREQLADVTLTDGEVTDIRLKTQKINGRILSAGDGWIEVEEYGRLPLAEDYKGYRLYGSLTMCTVRDIRFGYSFTDLCMEDGEICGILLAKEEAMEYIRVLIKAADYKGIYHAQPVLTADTGFSVIYGSFDDRKTETHQAGEEIVFSYDSPYFETDRVMIVPEALTGKVILQNVSRSQGIPAYRGSMELIRTQDGIILVNEVALEEYLYSVVPSEMPSRYPHEALKAQAICARTYAYGHMERAGYPQYGAHVDDSASYQVYNNILEQESTTTAVKETYGQLLYTAEGTLAETYYYSTSCGVGSDANVWKTQAAPLLTYLHPRHLSKTDMALIAAGGTETEDMGEKLKDEQAFRDFICSVNQDDFESGEGWYRWTYEVKELDAEYILEILKRRYAANSRLVLTWKEGDYVSEEIGELGEIRDLYIEKRGAGGVADELVIEGEENTYKVVSEHNIRYVLNNGKSKVKRQDGSEVASPNLLPSGFFVITAGKKDGSVVGYTLTGGGFGHGVGMSQNGAKQMAKSGWTAGDILSFFYEECVINNIFE